MGTLRPLLRTRTRRPDVGPDWSDEEDLDSDDSDEEEDLRPQAADIGRSALPVGLPKSYLTTPAPRDQLQRDANDRTSTRTGRVAGTWGVKRF